MIEAFEALVELAAERARAYLPKHGKRGEEAPGRACLRALLEAVAAQPATAALFFCDVYTVGERGRRAVDLATRELTVLARGAVVGRGGREELPLEMVGGVLGGIRAVIQSHLRRGEQGRLPGLAEELWRWACGYVPPPSPLRAPRRPRDPAAGAPPLTAYSEPERILRVLASIAAERGYPAVTVSEVAARASVSQATFYAHFPDKDAALRAALDSAGSQMLAVAMPAARRSEDWAAAVRAAIGGLCAFYASEPDLACLAIVEAYAAGPAALEQREAQLGELRLLLESGAGEPGLPPALGEALIGALWAILHAQLDVAGPRSLPRAAPLAAYVVLAPLVGASAAVTA